MNFALNLASKRLVAIYFTVRGYKLMKKKESKYILF